MSDHRHSMGAPDTLERCPIMPNYGAPSVMFVRGSGTELWDRDGKRYLDFLCGLAVTSLGHAHPVVADAIAEQARTLSHVSNLFGTEPQVELATTIDRLLGGGGQVFFCNSGAEANEAALKLARKHHGRGRHVVISAYRSFHGRTMATLHATGQPEKHEPFQPLPEGFRHVELNNAEALRSVLDPTVGAVLLEPLQGEGGVNPADASYVRDVRKMCDERGILLIFDEVQTGFARTGKWFGFEHFGVRPDIVTMAKALGNGMPIGACWARADISSAFKPGDHGTTFGGQPLAAAAARAVLRVMQDIDAPALSAANGARLAEKLRAVPGVVAVRGLGMLLGVELSPDVLDGRQAKDVANACLDAGLVVNGVTPTAVRFAPPLNISDAHLDEGVEIFASVLRSMT
jgi:predicted acetylornithine/succinylornithine family transaminase